MSQSQQPTRTHATLDEEQLAPSTLVIELPSTNPADLLTILGILDQIVAQLWAHHGDALTAHLVEDFRRRSPPPTVNLEPR